MPICWVWSLMADNKKHEAAGKLAGSLVLLWVPQCEGRAKSSCRLLLWLWSLGHDVWQVLCFKFWTPCAILGKEDLGQMQRALLNFLSTPWSLKRWTFFCITFLKKNQLIVGRNNSLAIHHFHALGKFGKSFPQRRLSVFLLFCSQVCVLQVNRRGPVREVLENPGRPLQDTLVLWQRCCQREPWCRCSHHSREYSGFVLSWTEKLICKMSGQCTHETATQCDSQRRNLRTFGC